jgi:hypothetical protein
VIAIPVGVVVGALISLASQRLTNRSNLRQARAERLWDRRADLYIRVIRANELFLGQLSAHNVGFEDPGSYPAYLATLDEHINALSDFSAEFIAFSSNEVNAVFGEFLTAGADLELAVRLKVETPELLKDGQPDKYLLERALYSTNAQLKETIRKDLLDEK